ARSAGCGRPRGGDARPPPQPPAPPAGRRRHQGPLREASGSSTLLSVATGGVGFVENSQISSFLTKSAPWNRRKTYLTCYVPVRTGTAPLDNVPVSHMDIVRKRPFGQNYAFVVVGVVFLALLSAAGMRSAPGVLLQPLEQAFGWSRGVTSFSA